MAKIHINNPKQVINGGAKKYFFKVKGLGGPKGDKGDTGATGPQGPQGPQGNAATVSVGSTTTLPVGQDATVQNVGTLYNAVLNFGIPQGPRGPQGATGATGAKGDKGDQGNPGPQGEKGTNATVYIGTTTTGEPGTQASVYNSGTDSNAVLNFTIPRGDVGPSVPLVQETGNSTTKAMSQNATTEALNGKQNTLTAGSNITISGNTISAKDTTYTAGDNIQINGSTISATDTTYTAGANIQIQNGTISATDTTYTAGNGLNLNGTEFSADTDVLATKEDLEGYYTKPETDNLLAPKLEAEVVAELPTTGAEGKLYLTPKAHTTSTATGNPIEATITEQAGQLESFQLDGDTFQQTYSGKNLLRLSDGTTTLGGVPITTTNGTVNLSGTATSAGQGYYVTINITASEPMVFTTNESGTTSGLVVKLQYKRGGTTYYPTVGSSLSLQAGDIIQQMYLIITNGTVLDGSFSPMLEVGSAATSFEPFVGGQPSPNPDYPQPIQTVTGLQTVEIQGKNKYPFNDTTWSSTSTSATWCFQDGALNAYGANVVDKTEYKLTLPAGTYTVSAFDISSNLIRIQVVSNGESVETLLVNSITSENPSATITLTEPTTICVRYRPTNPSLGIGNTKIQIELGSTASSFAPYSKQTLPIDLGTIELCKLGTYQDYIYKDGEDWKVHKEITKYVCDSTLNWTWDASVPRLSANSATLGLHVIGPINADTAVIGKSNKFVANSFNYVYTQKNNGFAYSQSGFISCVDKEWGSESEAKADILGSIFYFVLHGGYTTDTTITDTNLIAQLEAIRTAALENGANTITNTATGTNLAGDMEIGYFGFNPTNRYDKFIWLDLNNNYEQIGS